MTRAAVCSTCTHSPLGTFLHPLWPASTVAESFLEHRLLCLAILHAHAPHINHSWNAPAEELHQIYCFTHALESHTYSSVLHIPLSRERKRERELFILQELNGTSMSMFRENKYYSLERETDQKGLARANLTVLVVSRCFIECLLVVWGADSFQCGSIRISPLTNTTIGKNEH